MYRTIISAMRIGCAVAMVMFLAAPIPAETHEGEGPAAAKSVQKPEQMTSEKGSESMGHAAKAESTTAAPPKYQRLEHLIGKRVIDSQGEKLGHIEDIVLDSSSDSVGYAVLSYGGFLGVGDKLFAVPWSEVQTCPKPGAFLLDVRKEYLKDAPGF